MAASTFLAFALRNGISSFGVIPIRRVPEMSRRVAEEMPLLVLAALMASDESLIIA